MPTPDSPHFVSRAKRPYDTEAVETFPWPVTACYDDVHRWMDQHLAVYAAWQVRDAWESLIKFLGALAVADHLAAAPADDPRTSKLLALLLKARGLAIGDWPTLMQLALEDAPAKLRLSPLKDLLFPAKKRKLFELFVGGDATKSFVVWRNRRFGHGVLGHDLNLYVEEAKHWLDKLHDAYDLCRPFLRSLTLESDAPNGELLTWGVQPPLPFYHAHQPAAGQAALLAVRVRPGDDGVPLDLTPLLSVQACRVCGQWAAFYLDKYDKKKRAWFLDFVEGHSQDVLDPARLREWSERIRASDKAAAAEDTTDHGERREPNPELFRDFTDEFEPPVYLARQVAKWLAQRDRGVILLLGPAGVGKSWASRGLTSPAMLPTVLSRPLPSLHVSLHGPQPPDSGAVRTELREYARKQKKWQTPDEAEGPTPHARFAGWLSALMRANGLGELLVCLDGLDELPADSDVPDLLPPANELPPGCYLLLTSRPAVRDAVAAGLRRMRGQPDHLCEPRIDPHDPEHRAVLHRYAARQLARKRLDDQPPLPSAWVEPLIQRAEGRFLYTFHYCHALRRGVYMELSELPAPADYYPAFFTNVGLLVGDRLFDEYYARTLALLAVAREPLGLAHLTACGLERTRLIAVLDDLAELLRSRREPWDAETLYSLGHDAIRQFLTTDSAWQERLAGAEWFLAELTVRRFGSDWSAVDLADPVETYLLFHLLDHAKEPELRKRLLTDSALAEACFRHGYALYEQARWEPCLLANGIAISVRENQVQREGRLDLRADLAKVYLIRGAALDSLGRLEEALQSYAASCDLYETLVTREGRLDLRALLAGVYMDRGVALWSLDRLEEALQSCAACSDLYETLVTREGRLDLCALLASVYMNRGVVLRSLGRLEEALQSLAACSDINETLAQQEGCQDLRADLALVYMNRGAVLDGLGRPEEALQSYADCSDLWETLVQREGRLELRAELATVYMNRGVALDSLGRPEEAVQSYADCSDLWETLVQREGRLELRAKLAVVYMKRGEVLRSLWRLEEALQSYTASSDLYETLVQREGHLYLLEDLAWVFATRSALLLLMGDKMGAAQQSERVISILKSEVARTQRADFKKVLSVAESLLCQATE